MPRQTPPRIGAHGKPQHVHIVSEATTEDAIRYGLSDIDVRRLFSS
jgi:hypothetical protein